MNTYASLADDYFVNMNLNTEMQLPSARETILDFFGRVQKTFPSMRNFYTRENGDFVLEEDKDQPRHRWMSIEPRRICSGFVNPDTIDEALAQHKLALQLAPYMLSV
ncbi:MAG: hypothetical protein KDA52_17730, partial [Planctomycetaceae bacterium]|nr:hypothetical protein [Planctomycetaceae bacterium]